MIDTILNSPYLYGMLLIVLIVVSLIIIGWAVFSDSSTDNTPVKYHQTSVNGTAGKGNKYARYNGSDR